MNGKISKFAEKYSGTFRYAFALNLLILVVVHILFRPLNVTNDNLFIEMNCNGAYGAADPRLVYVNVLVGLFLKALYFLTSALPWFDLLSALVVFLSLSAIAYVLTGIFGNRLGTLMFVIIATFIAPQAYIRVNFTKTGGLASAAGLALLLFSSISARNAADPLFPGKGSAAGDGGTGSDRKTNDPKKVREEIVFGIILSCLGFCYRPAEFLAVSALIFPAFILYLIKGSRKRLIMSAVSLLVLLAAFYATDHAAYSLDPGWKKYSDLILPQSELFDYGFPSYDENKDRLEALGIKESAWKLLQSYNYADPEVFTLEVFEEIGRMKGEKRKLSGTVIKEFLREVPFGLFSEPEFYMALIFLLFFLIYAGKRPLSYVAAAGCLLMFSCLYLYLFLGGKYFVERVDMGLFLAMSLTFLFSASAGRKGEAHFQQPDMRMAFLATGAVIILSQSFLRDSWRIRTTKKAGISRGQTEKLMEMSNDRDHLYLCKMRYPDVENAFEPYDPIPAGIFSNVYFLGGWQVFEPVSLTPLRNYGVTNPYRDAVSDSRILFVDDDIELTLDYIHDYYDPDAEAVEAGQIGNEYRVYSIK